MRRALYRGSMPLLQMKGPKGTSLKEQVNLSNTMMREVARKKNFDDTLRKRFYVVKEETKDRRRGRVVGIDLGTTNSCLSYLDTETMQPKIIPSPTGSWVFPTAITFDKNHEVRLYGEEARACVRSSASATLCSGKRLIGRGFGELGHVQTELSRTNVLSLNEKGEVTVEVMGRTYTVLHIIAMFLRYMKNEAERFLKEPVDMAVVSVPAYFTPQQKVATEDAALAAGFDVLEIIDEPSAACLAYTVLSNIAHTNTNIPNPPLPVLNKRVVRSLVFDLGGGTLDCAVMEHNQRTGKFTLVATHGDPLLGGNDWDTVIMQHFASEFEAKWKVPIEDDEGNIAQGVQVNRNLSLEAEKAKIHFTYSTETYYGYNRAFHFSERLRDIVPLEATLSHEQYVTLTRPLRVRCLECINKLFKHVSLKATDIDHVLLVGAMTRDPPVRHMLQEFFGKPVVPEKYCPADYAVAIGAVVRGGMLLGKYPELTSNARFVSGTIQSLRHGGMVRRSWGKLKSLTMPTNPNAIGTRWRGKAKGLSDDEIAMYAKELVEFEAACARRLLIERAEDEANSIMRRVAADSNRKQGSQERRITQLTEQLKFWQYMVHNFHDHEDELLKTSKQLESILDELDGLAADNTSVTSSGTIDFSNAVAKGINRSLGLPEEDPALHAPAEATSLESESPQAPSTPSPSSTTPPAAAAAEKEEPTTQFPKILRRTVPLPSGSSEAAELVEAGHPVLRRADHIVMNESTRASFLEETVEDRAWREPPTPPGEHGSWAEVKEAIRAGESVGSPLPFDDLVRPMTCAEMYDVLLRICPIDDPPTAEHAILRNKSVDLHSITIVSGAVSTDDMAAIVQRMAEDLAALQQEGHSKTKEVREKVADISARLYH